LDFGFEIGNPKSEIQNPKSAAARIVRSAPVHEPNETLRKSIHILFGFFALTLQWLPWWVAAGVAACAVAGNWLLLHKIVGTRVSRHERGWDTGIVLYPLAVLILIVVFRDSLHVAAMAWATLAFGDGFATLAGKRLGGPRLPWNRDKRWSGTIAFVVLGFFPVWFIASEVSWPVVLAVVVAGAIAESLPTGVDDNLTVPFAAAITAAILSASSEPRLNLDAGHWLLLNTILALAGYALRAVDLGGMIGGWFLGAIIIICGGPTVYVVLLAFFVIGTASTKFGYRHKAAEGLAQEGGGRRGFGHAFANVGVAAICSVALALTGTANRVLWWAAVASLATAAADTVSSEIGQLIGRRAFLPLTFRSVPRGTEGAISLEGTLAGVAAAFVVAMIPGDLRMATFITLCAFLGSYVESILGSWNRSRGLGISNGALNFFNTAAGAGFFFAIASWL
jgi:uncharacterized protein (TIGR00297 family)